MTKGYRDILLTSLETRATAAGLHQGVTVSEFIAALSNSSLLGVELPEEIAKFLACYTRANIASGEELKQFTVNVMAYLPDSFFDKPLSSNRERPTVSDAVWLARIAIAQLGLTANGENNCSNLAELPLAA